jgi:formylglycine-generating enzyme
VVGVSPYQRNTPELEPQNTGDAGGFSDAQVADLDASRETGSPLVNEPKLGPAIEALGFTPKIHRQARFSWRQINGLNWQPFTEREPNLAPETPRDHGACQPGMLPVVGNFLVNAKGKDDDDEVHLAQNRACSLWRSGDHGTSGRCDAFDRDKWSEAKSKLSTKPLQVCIDRYEFPNHYGEYPLVIAMFSEAEGYCKAAGKRLCTESEWTFACEGEEGVPFPYGYERDKQICNIDVFGGMPDDDTLAPRTTAHTAYGIDSVFRGKRAGESPKCVSPFGAEDMTGNVDEWTRTVRNWGYKMIMKGGHWGPMRQRCRPQTRGHGPRYVRWDQGFRCCKDHPSAAK